MRRATRRICLAINILLMANATAAGASCQYPAAYFEISGQVQNCREISKDDQPFLQLTFDAPDVRETPCAGPTRDAIGTEVQDLRANFASKTRFFVSGWHQKSCSPFDGKSFRGTFEELCCDTVPATGACALDGPLVIPSSP